MRKQPNTDYPLPEDIRNNIPWFRRQLLKWFDVNQRNFPWRDTYRSPYEILIAEILLQRTKASKVSAFYIDFLAEYSRWSDLIEASQEQIEASLHSLGLWKQKAKVLKSLAEVANKDGIPETRLELEALPGVGQYIASAILVIVHGQKEAMVDVNMARVIERFFGPRQLADIRDDPYLQTLAKSIVTSENNLKTN